MSQAIWTSVISRKSNARLVKAEEHLSGEIAKNAGARVRLKSATLRAFPKQD